jgi:hypothetical protein
VEIDDIFADPVVLAGMRPPDLLVAVKLSPAWRIETLGDGSHGGEGFVLREYRTDGSLTRRVIRWHPGGGHHGPLPYGRVSAPAGGKSKLTR